jgi:hypothetical protein
MYCTFAGYIPAICCSVGGHIAALENPSQHGMLQWGDEVVMFADQHCKNQ